MIPEQMRTWIDNATYEALLQKWRHAAIGNPFFVGVMGEYYQVTMAAKRKEIGIAAAVQASKRVGWTR